MSVMVFFAETMVFCSYVEQQLGRSQSMDFRVNLCCENCERKVKRSLKYMDGKLVQYFIFLCMLKNVPSDLKLSWMLCLEHFRTID